MVSIKFRSCPASVKLLNLAMDCVDLTANGVITEKRLCKMVMEGCRLLLCYGTERVDNVVIKALFELAMERSVIDNAYAIYNGISSDGYEGLSATHMCTRCFFDQTTPSESVCDAYKLAYEELEKLRAFLDLVDGESFTDFIHVGIGGSSLGPMAVYRALKAFGHKGRRVHFVSNVDADQVVSVVDGIDLSKTIVCIVSKSGTTQETLSNEWYLREKFLSQGHSPDRHFISVTMRGTSLDAKDKYREVFYIDEGVVGRYSTTSMVGGVMLAFALGMEKFLDFLRGANDMDKVAMDRDVSVNLPLFSSLLHIWNCNFLCVPSTLIVSYSDALALFPSHLQQCFMESNGKNVDMFGSQIDFWTSPVVYGGVGTDMQHSLGQFLHQGMIPFSVVMVGFLLNQSGEDTRFDGTTANEKLLANLFSQSLTLALGNGNDVAPSQRIPGNHQNHIILAKKCDPYTVGNLISYFEHVAAFMGIIWGINPFDQKGVDEGKKCADNILRRLFDNETDDTANRSSLIDPLLGSVSKTIKRL